MCCHVAGQMRKYVINLLRLQGSDVRDNVCELSFHIPQTTSFAKYGYSSLSVLIDNGIFYSSCMILFVTINVMSNHDPAEETAD